MQATWIQDAALMLFVWLIAHHYQYWGVIGAAKEKQPEPSPAEKKPEGTGKEFQGLTVKPECPECEHPEPAAVVSRVPPPRIKPKRGRPRTVPTGLQFCPYDACDYYG